jgi:hypothetical protein
MVVNFHAGVNINFIYQVLHIQDAGTYSDPGIQGIPVVQGQSFLSERPAFKFVLKIPVSAKAPCENEEKSNI